MNINPSTNRGQFFLQEAKTQAIRFTAATLSVTAVFYGFVLKSCRQNEKPAPKMSVSLFKDGFKGGGFVATQFVAQDLFEKFVLKQNDKQSLEAMVASSLFVGGLSSPFLAIFNGLSNGISWRESLKRFQFKHAAAISVRETCFLGAVKAAEPISDHLDKRSGGSKMMKVFLLFTVPMLGSFAGHGPDALLNLWQNNKTFTNKRQLLNGGLIRGLTVGTFAVLNSTLKDAFTKKLEK